MRIAVITVPHSGGGSPSVVMDEVYSVASGGILPVLNTAAYPASPHEGQFVYDITLDKAFQFSNGHWQQVSDIPDVAASITGGFVAGTSPIPHRKVGWVNAVNTNSSSNLPITFSSAFPNGIIGVLLTSATQGAPQLVSNTQTTGGFIIVAKTPTGGAYASQALSCYWEALGW